MPRKLPRQRRAQLTFDAILDAAADLLIARGYHRMTTNAVAERAGVSVGSLYQYFPNKQALVAALRDRHRADIQRTMAAAFAASRELSLEEGIRHNIAANFVAQRTERALQGALMAAAAAVPKLHDAEPRASVVAALVQQFTDHGLGDSEEARRAGAELVYEVVKAVVHRAVVDGAFDADETEVVRQLQAMVIEFMQSLRRPVSQ